MRLKLIYGLGVINRQEYEDAELLMALREELNHDGNEYAFTDDEILGPFGELHCVAALPPPPQFEPADSSLYAMQIQRYQQAVRSIVHAVRQYASCFLINPVRPEDVIYSYVRAVTLNKSGAFILNVLGWQPENIASQLKKIDDHTVQVQWSADVSPALALNILSTPIASIIIYPLNNQFIFFIHHFTLPAPPYAGPL